MSEKTCEKLSLSELKERLDGGGHFLCKSEEGAYRVRRLPGEDEVYVLVFSNDEGVVDVRTETMVTGVLHLMALQAPPGEWSAEGGG